MPKLRFVGRLASLALLLTACDTSASHTAGRAEGGGVLVPSQPTVVNFVDPSRVTGLGTETIALDSPHVHVSYPTLADAPRFNQGLRTWLAREVREHIAGLPDQSGPTELNVDWRLTAASPDIVGVRLRRGAFTGDTWDNGYHTIWYDRTDGSLHRSAELVKGDALSALADVTRRMAKTRATGIAADRIGPDSLLFDSLNFNRRGDLVVEFDEMRVVPNAMGRAAVAVPAATAGPLLSDLGRRVQATVRSAAPQTVVPQTVVPQTAGPPTTGPPTTASPTTGSPTTAPPTVRTTPEPRRSNPGTARPAGTDCSKVKCVALTFDDGPGPHTPELLEIMARHHACGTFFTAGLNAAAQPHLVKRIQDSCGLVANHTWSHRDLTTLSKSRIADQIRRGQHAVSAATGAEPTLLGAPYGAVDGEVAAIARELGLTIVSWTVNPGDRHADDPAALARTVIDGAARNAIILLHETRRATVQALPRILDALTKRGYVFVTVPDLGG